VDKWKENQKRINDLRDEFYGLEDQLEKKKALAVAEKEAYDKQLAAEENDKKKEMMMKAAAMKEEAERKALETK